MTSHFSQLKSDVDGHLKTYSDAAVSAHRMAFWHDVGVTGISAIATVSLGVAGLTANAVWANQIRAFALFFTAAATVFSACNHFFRFKAMEQIYRGAAVRSLALSRKLDRVCGDPSCDATLKFYDEIDAIVSSIDPVWPGETVWKSRRGLGVWGVVIGIVLIGLGVITYHVAGNPNPACGQTGTAGSK
jgi:hypothetical protein